MGRNTYAVPLGVTITSIFENVKEQVYSSARSEFLFQPSHIESTEAISAKTQCRMAAWKSTARRDADGMAATPHSEHG